MNEEAKKVLEEFRAIKDELDKMAYMGPLKPGTPIHCYTTEEVDKMLDLYAKETQALEKYRNIICNGNPPS